MRKEIVNNAVSEDKSLLFVLGLSIPSFTSAVPIPNSADLNKTIVAKTMKPYLHTDYSDFNFKQEWNNNGFRSAVRELMPKAARYNPFTYVEIGLTLARIYISAACDVFSATNIPKPKSNGFSIALKILLLTPVLVANVLFKVIAQPKRVYNAAKYSFSVMKNTVAKSRFGTWFKAEFMGGKTMTIISDTITVRRKRKSSTYSDALQTQKKRRKSISMSADDIQSMEWDALEYGRQLRPESGLNLSELGLFSQAPEKTDLKDAIELQSVVEHSRKG